MHSGLVGQGGNPLPHHPPRKRMQHRTHPALGFGLGLRTKHYAHILEHKPPVDWFEIISENFMDTDGKPMRNLDRIREHYPIVMHGVSLSIGTLDPLNSEYLHKLKALIARVQPAWVSDHLCWTGVAHKNTHDLLPVPYTEEALRHIVQRIRAVQDFLQRPIALENPSTYLEFNHSSMPEAEFIARMAQEADCNLLLDVNNVYVTCFNHRLDPKAYIDSLPLERVSQIHLSGHSNKGTHIIDTHDGHVVDDVWDLYKYVLNKAGRTPNTMIEWDDHIPEFPVLLAELGKAKAAAEDAANYRIPALFSAQVPQRANRETPLLEAQHRMQEAVMRGERFDSQPEQWIRSKESFSPAEQLAVYTNAYRYRLYDSTAEDYPVLQHYLGEEAFRALVWDYVNHAQPTHFNIARYTLAFPGFVKEQLPQNLCAYELSQLETAIVQLADLKELPPLEEQHLNGMTPDLFMQAQLHPRAALQLLCFDYAVNDYYRAVMDEEQPAQPQAQASCLAVFRHEDRIWRMELEPAEYALLQKLFSGVRVGEALESMGDEYAEKISSWFSRWMRNGLLAAPEYTGNEPERTQHAAA